jgi:hypothetical protein
MKHVLVGAILAAASILTSARPAGATTQDTVDAYCVRTTHGTLTTPVDPGTVDTPQSDALNMTGTMSCIDATGAPLATGTVNQAVNMPRIECTGEQNQNTSQTVVTWSDGTVSTFTFNRTDVIKTNGTAGLIVSGSVTTDSALFAGATVNGAGTGTSVGCGTATGETNADSVLVLHLTR